jgi:hypothetical protein
MAEVNPKLVGAVSLMLAGVLLALLLDWTGIADLRIFGRGEPEVGQGSTQAQEGSDDDAVEASSGATSEPQPSSNGTATEDDNLETFDDGAQTSTVAPVVTRSYLAEQEWVSVQRESASCTGGCVGARFGPAEIGTDSFPRSLLIPVSQSSYAQATWNNSSRCGSLTAAAGVSNEAPDGSLRFEVSRDGGPFQPVARATVGEPQEIDIALEGTRRFILSVTAEGFPDGSRVLAIWGDPTFICGGSSGPDAASRSMETQESPRAEYLSNLDWVSVERRSTTCTGGCVGARKAGGTLGGESFARSIITPIDSSSYVQSTWNSFGQCGEFQATVGLSNDSPDAVVHFDIIKDGGEPVRLATLTRAGEGESVSTSLENVSRYTLMATSQDFSGTTNRGTVIWGDALMTQCSD